MPWRSYLVSLTLLATFTCPVCYGQEEEVVLGKKRSEWLAILKDHKETKFRRAAVVVLGVLGPRVKGVVDALYDAVENDPDPEVRREIVLTLGRMGSEAKGAADVLGDVLKRDTAGAVREAAALSLAGKLNDQAFTQVLTLAGAMKDPHPGTRAAAAEALKNLGEKAKIALPQLTALAQDQKADRFPRLYAIQMISKWGDDATLKVLVGIFEEKGAMPAIRRGAIEGIGRMGEKAEPAIPVLARGLKEADVNLRRAAAVALGQVGDQARDAWGAIKEAYQDTDNGVRNQVIRLAGRVGKDEKEAVLVAGRGCRKGRQPRKPPGRSSRAGPPRIGCHGSAAYPVAPVR